MILGVKSFDDIELENQIFQRENSNSHPSEFHGKKANLIFWAKIVVLEQCVLMSIQYYRAGTESVVNQRRVRRVFSHEEEDDSVCFHPLSCSRGRFYDSQRREQ